LGIETSCDETAVAIVDETRACRADLVQSQIAVHAPYGGSCPSSPRARISIISSRC
jgi:N6-L-threonylcarbamoyladenine synthase